MSSFLDTLKITKPKVATEGKPSTKASGDLWVKCKGCDSPIYRKVLEEKFKVCDKCGYHHKMSSYERLSLMTEPGSFEEMFGNIYSVDPLDFGEEYRQKIVDDQKKTGLSDAVLTGTANIDKHRVGLGIMDFFFRGGSMGSVVGEKITRIMEYSADNGLPCIIVTCSGGARMQEGVLSLMQLCKTNNAVIKMAEAKVPYIVVMTDPTTAGVAASFASIGDIILAEPGSMIGFSGRRVIEQTIRQKLPDDFQTAEFYDKHGFIDRVVHRKNLKQTISRILDFYYPENSSKSPGKTAVKNEQEPLTV